MKRSIPLLCGLLLLWVSACTHAPVKTVTYVLPNPAIELNNLDEAPSINVRDVKIANYLNQGGMVIKQNEVTIQITQQNRWGEPLGKGIKRYLNRSLAGKPFEWLPESEVNSYHIDLSIDAFEANDFDSVYTSGSWTLYPDVSNDVVRKASFSITTPIETQTYEGMVIAFASLLEQLAAEIEGE